MTLKRFVCLSAVAATLALPSVRVRATTILKRSFDDVCARAEDVFCGTVASVQSRLDHQSGTIHTYTTFENIDWILGGDGQLRYTVRTLGGTVGGQSLVVDGMPRFKLGQRYILFLHGNNHYACPVIGWHQGCFRIVEGDHRGRPQIETYAGRRVLSAGPEGVVTDVQSGPRSPRATPMTLDRFVEVTRAALARTAHRRPAAEGR